MLLEFEPRAFYMLGKCSIIELHLAYSPVFTFYFETGSYQVT